MISTDKELEHNRTQICTDKHRVSLIIPNRIYYFISKIRVNQVVFKDRKKMSRPSQQDGGFSTSRDRRLEVHCLQITKGGQE